MTDETDILARTIFGEARGESVSGMEAVASVVMNRLAVAGQRGGYWWGGSVREICLCPRQFSCWNPEDPNYQLITKVTGDNPVFAVCRRIAGRAVSGVLRDSTDGATHYHTRAVNPRWARGKIPCAEIGRHFFYNDIEEN